MCDAIALVKDAMSRLDPNDAYYPDVAMVSGDNLRSICIALVHGEAMIANLLEERAELREEWDAARVQCSAAVGLLKEQQQYIKDSHSAWTLNGDAIDCLAALAAPAGKGE